MFKNTEQPFEWVDIDKIEPEIVYDSEYSTIVVLKMDIEKNGLRQPIFVNKENNQILLGNQRYTVLQLLNTKGKIPVRYRK